MNSDPEAATPLALARAAAYAAPVSTTTFMLAGSTTVLPGLYAKYFAVPLSTIALLMFAIRLGDAFVDPVIGYGVDRWHARGGSRRAVALVGLLCLGASGWFMMSPPANPGAGWFGVWMLLAYFAWSLFEIPHNAWGTELARGYGERARLYGIRTIGYYVGSLLFFVVPLLGAQGEDGFTPDSLRALAYVGVALVCITSPLLLLVPARGAGAPVDRPARVGAWLSVLRNRPLLAFLGAFFLAGLGLGMWGGLLYLFVDVYLKLGREVALVFALGSPVGILAVPLWSRAAASFGKRNAWLVGTIALLACVAAMGLLPPGPQGKLPLLAITLAVFAIGACQAAVAPAILADITDYGRWRFGADRAATYYAAFSITSKAVVGIGAAAALGLADLLGFDPGARSLDEQAVFALKIAFAWIPVVCMIAALPLVWVCALSPRHVGILQRRLARRATA